MSLGKYNFTSLFFYVTIIILLFSCQKQKKTYYESKDSLKINTELTLANQDLNLVQ